MKKKNGITVLSSEVKYSKRGLKVVEENFRHKHGDGEYRYIVLAPQVRVVPLTPEGDFVLINEFKYPQNEFVLGFPAGTVEGGESFLEAAKRELGEETSYTAESFIDFGPYLLSEAQARGGCGGAGSACRPGFRCPSRPHRCQPRCV